MAVRPACTHTCIPDGTHCQEYSSVMYVCVNNSNEYVLDHGTQVCTAVQTSDCLDCTCDASSEIEGMCVRFRASLWWYSPSHQFHRLCVCASLCRRYLTQRPDFLVTFVRAKVIFILSTGIRTRLEAMPWHRVAAAANLSRSPGARLHVTVEGRYVSVIRSKANPRKLYCIDSICYHMGGPLTVGDIEDYGGRECIVCPWHHYAVTLDDGAKMYQSLVMKDGKMCPGDYKSINHQQRTHPVEIRVRACAYVWIARKFNCL